MKIRIILTGSTGMVGEGVLRECLSHPDIEAVLLVNRKPAGVNHPKVKEIIHPDFLNLSPIADQLKGYDACFFCLGVSSVGMDKTKYFSLTYTLTMDFAQWIANPTSVFCYISGAGTDSTEKGRIAWARVKGKTENDLMKLPFRKVYNFRPGILKATKGLKNTLSLYKYLSWMLPIIGIIAPNSICSLQQLGQAMINATIKGYDKQILEVKDIVKLAKS